jgi:glutamate-5-semialdehyde dehydrogenase
VTNTAGEYAADQRTTDAWAVIDRLGRQARAAARALAAASSDEKDAALRACASALRQREAELLRANAIDIALAREKGRPDAFIDRLRLDVDRIEAMATAIERIAGLDDPVGRTLHETTRPNGLRISRVATPIGVIGMIFESRPNVAADAGALCAKSGNAVILRGGSEGLQSSLVIVSALQQGFASAGLPEHAVQVVDTPDREAVTALLRCVEHIDLVIPRGGHGLVSLVSREARVPTLLHLDGNCHSYVHSAADPLKAIQVIRNAKLRRTGICGATESLVVDAAIAPELLPQLIEAMPECSFRGDEIARRSDSRIEPAATSDWSEEYLDAILSVRVVENMEEALTFIAQHSSGHTDAILTEDEVAAETFLNTIDSAVVMHNASTQFSDGGEFGMGAEIGIATGKMHARGPVGLEQLTSFKYQVRGNGQTRS